MAVRVTEKPKQAGTIQFRAPKARAEYTVSGTLSRLEAQIALAAACPASVPGCDVDGTEIDIFLQKLDLNEIGGGVWHGTADYANTPDQIDLSFHVGTQTTKYFQALEHVRTYDCVVGGSNTTGPLNGIPDFNGAIGVNGESVDGVDVEIAKLEFTITIKRSFASLAASYLWTIANMTPSVNDEDFTFTFKGQTFTFPRGSVLFRGCPMSVNSDNQVQFQFGFSYSKNIGLDAPLWDAGTTYGTGDRVIFEFRVFESVGAGNLDNEPVSVEYSGGQTFTTGDKVIFEGHVYSSLIDGNFGHQPDENPGDWQDDGPTPWTNVGPTDGELRVGDSDPIVKEGWHHMWPWFQQTASAGVAYPKARAVVIDRVYKYAKFSAFGLTD